MRKIQNYSQKNRKRNIKFLWFCICLFITYAILSFLIILKASPSDSIYLNSGDHCITISKKKAINGEKFGTLLCEKRIAKNKNPKQGYGSSRYYE
ncbi:MAG: hypothetical protein LBF02_00815 [Mycoplasmataceae bacterium]|jgi:hypothetical protein|nr:hypothetical protein [Mycoplasmataceae bacterium]